MFVGRAGGLAVALGIGVALFSPAQAWGEAAAPDPSAAPAGASGGINARPGTLPSARATAKGPTKAGPADQTRLARPTSTLRAQGARAELMQTAARPPFLGVQDTMITGVDDTVNVANESLAVPVVANVPGSAIDTSPVPPAELLLGAKLLEYSRREAIVSGLLRSAVAPTIAPLPTATAAVQPAAAENIALIMGESGNPIPNQSYVDKALDWYVEPNYPGAIARQLVTPELLYPITPYPYVKVLPLNISVQQGNQILYDAILQQLAADNTVTAFGWSQSAIISSLVMDPNNANCVNTATCGLEADAPVNFVLVGNEMNPNGGLLSRFPGLNLASLGLEFYGATPENSFQVANYTLEYDGFADFPQYPINFLSTLNAVLGIALVHDQYFDLTEEQRNSAIALPTTSDSQKYFMIPTQDLPLLAPLRMIPVIGKPIADLLQPALRVLVNLGYGDPKYGWSQGNANVATPFGFLPPVDWAETLQLFVAGIGKGIENFIAAVQPGGSMWQELSSHASQAAAAWVSLPSLLSGTAYPSLQSAPAYAGSIATSGSFSQDLTAPQSQTTAVQSIESQSGPLVTTPEGIIRALQTMVTQVSETISRTASILYAALLPTADIINAMLTTVPAYAFNLFLSGIEQALSGDILGGLINAIGLPVAAAVGLFTTGLGIEALVLGRAIQAVFAPA